MSDPSSPDLATLLARLVREVGSDLAEHRATLHARLREGAPDQPRAVYLLMNALDAGVPTRLRERGSATISDNEIGQEAAVIVDQFGSSPDHARASVETWAKALALVGGSVDATRDEGPPISVPYPVLKPVSASVEPPALSPVASAIEPPPKTPEDAPAKPKEKTEASPTLSTVGPAASDRSAPAGPTTPDAGPSISAVPVSPIPAAASSPPPLPSLPTQAPAPRTLPPDLPQAPVPHASPSPGPMPIGQAPHPHATSSSPIRLPPMPAAAAPPPVQPLPLPPTAPPLAAHAAAPPPPLPGNAPPPVPQGSAGSATFASLPPGPAVHAPPPPPPASPAAAHQPMPLPGSAMHAPPPPLLSGGPAASRPMPLPGSAAHPPPPPLPGGHPTAIQPLPLPGSAPAPLPGAGVRPLPLPGSTAHLQRAGGVNWVVIGPIAVLLVAGSIWALTSAGSLFPAKSPPASPGAPSSPASPQAPPRAPVVPPRVAPAAPVAPTVPAAPTAGAGQTDEGFTIAEADNPPNFKTERIDGDPNSLLFAFGLRSGQQTFTYQAAVAFSGTNATGSGLIKAIKTGKEASTGEVPVTRSMQSNGYAGFNITGKLKGDIGAPSVCITVLAGKSLSMLDVASGGLFCAFPTNADGQCDGSVRLGCGNLH